MKNPVPLNGESTEDSDDGNDDHQLGEGVAFLFVHAPPCLRALDTENAVLCLLNEIKPPLDFYKSLTAADPYFDLQTFEKRTHQVKLVISEVQLTAGIFLNSLNQME